MSQNRKKNQRARKQRGRKIVAERRAGLSRRKKMGIKTPGTSTIITLFLLFLLIFTAAWLLFLFQAR